VRDQAAPASCVGTEQPAARRRRGVPRLRAALANSLRAFSYLSRHEAAFRQELVGLLVSVPAAAVLATSLAHYLVLVGTVLAVMLVEILNTGIEAACNAVTREHNADIRLAKDCGSLAVLIALIIAGMAWLHALWLIARTAL
jgi:diacylglycerol kinase (ATP)